MKIAFSASEVVPFAKTGGLADVCGSLPLALEHFGADVSVFMPYYKCVNEAGYQIDKIFDDLYTAKIGKNVKVYFIKNDHFYFRDGLYGSPQGDYLDNLERFKFLCKKSLEFLKILNFKADVFHCNDWQSALIPVYIKERFNFDSFYHGMKSLLTIHNIAYQGVFPKEQFSSLELHSRLFSPQNFEFYSRVNLLKAGIIFSDKVSTVSQQYAREIQTKEFGWGLENIMKSNAHKLVGIMNGVDYAVWNPALDNMINENYTPQNYKEIKQNNKMDLQKELGLPVNKDIPVYGFVGRLSHQKGIDLMINTLYGVHDMNVQVIIQGVGSEDYARRLRELEYRFPQKIRAVIKFGEHIAHQIYAGSDFFLMPSLFEPCGLSQLISLKYGTIPIVYKTGGLIDTIKSIKDNQDFANGFSFDRFNNHEFYSVIKWAESVFYDKPQLEKMINNAFNSDFSWDKSAKEYFKLYQSLHNLG